MRGGGAINISGAIWRAGDHYESNPKNTDFSKWDSGRSGRDPVPTILARKVDKKRAPKNQKAQKTADFVRFCPVPIRFSPNKNKRKPAENLIF